VNMESSIDCCDAIWIFSVDLCKIFIKPKNQKPIIYIYIYRERERERERERDGGIGNHKEGRR